MTTKHRLQTPFTVDDAWSLQFGTINDEVSLTQQSDAEECDINVIMTKYNPAGAFPQVTDAPTYGDFSGVTDYRSALELVQRADEAFAEVPAETRRLFNNSPSAYLEFVENPENKDKIKELGLGKISKIPETTLADIAKILQGQIDGKPIVSTPPVNPASGAG